MVPAAARWNTLPVAGAPWAKIPASVKSTPPLPSVWQSLGSRRISPSEAAVYAPILRPVASRCTSMPARWHSTMNCPSRNVEIAVGPQPGSAQKSRRCPPLHDLVGAHLGVEQPLPDPDRPLGIGADPGIALRLVGARCGRQHPSESA